jgi:hypothetical protein
MYGLQARRNKGRYTPHGTVINGQFDQVLHELLKQNGSWFEPNANVKYPTGNWQVDWYYDQIKRVKDLSLDEFKDKYVNLEYNTYGNRQISYNDANDSIINRVKYIRGLKERRWQLAWDESDKAHRREYPPKNHKILPDLEYSPQAIATPQTVIKFLKDNKLVEPNFSCMVLDKKTDNEPTAFLSTPFANDGYDYNIPVKFDITKTMNDFVKNARIKIDEYDSLREISSRDLSGKILDMTWLTREELDRSKNGKQLLQNNLRQMERYLRDKFKVW